jgi:hypothetical protein
MPEGFSGSFGEHIQEARRRREVDLRNEGETDDDAIAKQSEDEAQFSEAERWLVEHWGEEFPCSACSNVQWIVSNVFPAYNGLLSFQTTCRYCGNSMTVIPGHADLTEPILREQQRAELD